MQLNESVMTTVDEAINAGLRDAKKRSPLIIIVGADKGGVGKTTIARALTDYLARNGSPVRAFDTEAGEGVFKRFYPQAEMLNAATVQGQMSIVDAAKTEAVTLVDARAGLLTPILKAFAKIDLFGDVKVGALRLLVLHIVGSSVASASEIAPIVAALADAKLVRVNNKMTPDATFAAVHAGEVTIEVPNLEEDAAAAVDASGVGFAAFAGDDKQSRVLRGYVRAWLTQTQAAFDSAGIAGLIR